MDMYPETLSQTRVVIPMTVRVYVAGRGKEDVVLQRRLDLSVVPAAVRGAWPGRLLDVTPVCDILGRVVLEATVIDEEEDVRDLALDAGPGWEVLPASEADRWGPAVEAVEDRGKPPF